MGRHSLNAVRRGRYILFFFSVIKIVIQGNVSKIEKHPKSKRIRILKNRNPKDK